MTPDDARNYFFQHLPQVRDASDLLRLTFWVLPYLPADPTRPLGQIETMAFHLQLEHSKYDEKIRVWYSSNRDVSTQISMLDPIYSRGSSGPSFCSGLSARMSLPNGPNVRGPGLSLGAFAKEHQTAQKKLEAATTVEQWWNVFLGQTPLWMRTAYNWKKPTPEQKNILKTARKNMLAHVPELATKTKISYDNRSGDSRLHVRFDRMNLGKTPEFNKAPHWNALVAGQQFLKIDDTQEKVLDFDGFQNSMPGVQDNVRSICQIVCSLQGWTEMGELQVERAVERAKANADTMKTQAKVDVGLLLDAPEAFPV